jgi:hypothetical protein
MTRSFSLHVMLGDDFEDGTGSSGHNNSYSSDLSASERGDSMSGSIHCLSPPFVRSGNSPRKGSLRDLLVSSPDGGSRHSRRSLSKHNLPTLPLTRMDEQRDYDEDNEQSFEFGGDYGDGEFHATDAFMDSASLSHEQLDTYSAMSNFDDNRIDFENSEFFEALELDYVDALQENSKRLPSIRFAEENDLLDDVVRSKNLGYQAPDEFFLDIFDENKRNTSPTGDGSSVPRYPLYDDDDDESIYDDVMGDENSMEEEESEERKILKGIFFSAGGMAIFAGIGFVAQRLMSGFQKSDDVDVGGAEMYNGAEQSATVADAAVHSAHTAESASDAVQIVDAAIEASFHATFEASSSTLGGSGLAAAGSQGAAVQ